MTGGTASIPTSSPQLLQEIVAPKENLGVEANEASEVDSPDTNQPAQELPFIAPFSDFATPIQPPAAPVAADQDKATSVDPSAESAPPPAAALEGHQSLSASPKTPFGGNAKFLAPSAGADSSKDALKNEASVAEDKTGVDGKDDGKAAVEFADVQLKPEASFRQTQPTDYKSKPVQIESARPAFQPAGAEISVTAIAHETMSNQSAPPTKDSPAPIQFASHAPPAHFSIVSATATPTRDGGVEIRLDPPELGRLSIEFARGEDGVVTAMVAAERPETLDIMRRHGELLLRELARFGIGDASLQFSSRGWSESGDRPSSERRRFAFSADHDAQREGPASGMRKSVNRFDLFA
jgi:flagellar hook-length control protein FliK